MTIISRASTRLVAIALIKIGGNDLFEYLITKEKTNPSDLLLVLFHLSIIIASTLFIIAVVANSLRWFNLIRVELCPYKPYEKYIYKLILLGIIVFLGFYTLMLILTDF